MPSLKRTFIYESIESSSDEEILSPCVKKARKAMPIEVIDLTQDDDDDNSAPTASPSARKDSAVSLSAADEKDSAAVQPSTPAPALSPVESDLAYKNPFEICERSLFKKIWSKKDYIKFFDEVKSHFDPSHFEGVTGKPAEEIMHVWETMVAEPVRENLLALNEVGDLNKHWPNGKIVAELHHIETGRVLVVYQAEESEGEIEGLSGADLEFLKGEYEEDVWELVPAA